MFSENAGKVISCIDDQLSKLKEQCNSSNQIPAEMREFINATSLTVVEEWPVSLSSAEVIEVFKWIKGEYNL